MCNALTCVYAYSIARFVRWQCASSTLESKSLSDGSRCLSMKGLVDVARCATIKIRTSRIRHDIKIIAVSPRRLHRRERVLSFGGGSGPDSSADNIRISSVIDDRHPNLHSTLANTSHSLFTRLAFFQVSDHPGYSKVIDHLPILRHLPPARSHSPQRHIALHTFPSARPLPPQPSAEPLDCSSHYRQTPQLLLYRLPFVRYIVHSHFVTRPLLSLPSA